MIFELREYVAVPGRSTQVHRRFQDHVLDLFVRHHLDVVGYWIEPADEGRVLYLLRFADEVARQQAWAAFQSDTDWQRVKAESESQGPIVAQMTSRVLTEPSYWTARTDAGSHQEELPA